MNRLNKDQIQKIVLSTILLVGSVVAYIVLVFQPLKAKIIRTTGQIAATEKAIKTADGQIRKTAALEPEATKASELLAHLQEVVPEGAPIAWFPLKMSSYFSRHDISDVVTRQGPIETIGDAGGEKFQDQGWSVEIPKAGFIPLGMAVAGLENEEPLLEIISFEISRSDRDPEFQVVKLGISHTLPK